MKRVVQKLSRRCLLGVLVLSLACSADLPSGGAEEVSLVRDAFGVPHIFAETPEGAAYGVAVAQCEDNLPIVVYCLFAGVGRLSELMGPTYRDVDIDARTLGHAHYARRDWPKLQPPLRRLVQAYCDGVNDYLQAHPNELQMEVPPVEPIQVVAWHRSVFLLAAVAISRADAEASKADGYHPVYGPDSQSRQHPGVPPGKSNSWALSGSRTKAGVPMLLIDPHWPAEGHLQLYEAYLHGGDLQVGGFMLNGTPLPGIGVSPAAAWTVTAGGADSSDAYALKIHPDNPRQYEFDGQWQQMVVRQETLRIRHENGCREEPFDALSTRHGPLLTTSNGTAFAAAFSGWDRADVLEQTYRMAMARSGQQFKEAIALDRYSYFNLMWATAEGDIGYVQTGQVPLRPAGLDWQKMVPGWTREALYRGMVPFDRLPAVENPPSGFLQNCNVAANMVTPGLTYTQDDFPIGALYGHYGAYRARGHRATQLLGQTRQATLDDARRIAFDSYVPPADLWVPVILQAYQKHRERPGKQENAEERELLSQAAGLLRAWDRYATRDSCGATLFRFWRLACHEMPGPVGRDAFQIANTPQVRRDALAALKVAACRLKTNYGKLAVPWGEIKRLKRSDQQWPLSGDGLGKLGMDTLRATAADTFNEDHKLIARGGQCVTSVVLLTNPPVIRSVVAYGQSNRPESPHYADQAPLYSQEQFREVLWARDQVESQSRSRRTLHYRPD